MIKTRIAKRYARALFELASEAGRIEEIGADLSGIGQLFTDNETVRQGLTSPVTTSDAKAEILTAVIEASKLDTTVANFLQVVLAARKMPVLPQIVAAYQSMADEATGKLRGEAIAPVALDAASLAKLSQALGKALGKEVILDARQDASLLGGVVARVGTLVYDASVKTQLQRMKESLTKG